MRRKQLRWLIGGLSAAVLTIALLPFTSANAAGGPNLALGKPISASGTVGLFSASNANDGNPATYWESTNNAFPQWLQVDLGSATAIDQVVLKLPTNWGARTQTLSVQGSTNGTAFSTLSPSAARGFNPASANSVTINFTAASVRYVRLNFTANTGWPAGQIAEFEIYGVSAPPPTGGPVVLVSAGKPMSASSAQGGFPAGNANDGNQASYWESTNNVFPQWLQVDLGANFAVSRVVLKLPASWGARTETLAVQGSTNGTSFTDLAGSAGRNFNPASSNVVTISFTAASTRYVRLNITANTGWPAGQISEFEVYGSAGTPPTTTAPPTSNPPTSTPPTSTPPTPPPGGRGATMPYAMYEAEDGSVGGGAAVVGPNREIGNVAGEASGRRAVTLNSTGAFVQWTTRAATNTLVVRVSIPDAAGGGGLNSTLNIYVNGAFHKAINVTSKYSWVYGAEASPNNSPSSGPPRHIYDEASTMLNSSIPAGSTIRLQKDAANNTTYAVDFVNLEQVAPIANPDPARYVVPTGFTQQAVQTALDQARMNTAMLGVYLPAGDYSTDSKLQVFGRAIRVVGAGPWYTRFLAPQGGQNNDIGVIAGSGSNGSTFANFAYFGNYVERIDGPGKVFLFQNVSNITIDNIWVEHQVVMYWGVNTDNMIIRNSRIRNTWADGVNMTNGSAGNLVSNIDARGNGDDAFALFAANDAGGTGQRDNIYENLSATLVWRAAGLAVYGGTNNIFRNIYIADILVYSGVTISSLDFGFPMEDFGASPPTQFNNISIVRAGGHFWGQQSFPGMWLFSASRQFRGIRVSNLDIIDPTYTGIMFQTNYVGSAPQNPITDTIFTNVTISGAHRAPAPYDLKSGFALWCNALPEAGQGPAVGSVTFNNLVLRNNDVDIQNTCPNFTIIRN